jgi:hypothetical protein
MDQSVTLDVVVLDGRREQAAKIISRQENRAPTRHAWSGRGPLERIEGCRGQSRGHPRPDIRQGLQNWSTRLLFITIKHRQRKGRSQWELPLLQQTWKATVGVAFPGAAFSGTQRPGGVGTRSALCQWGGNHAATPPLQLPLTFEHRNAAGVKIAEIPSSKYHLHLFDTTTLECRE